MFRWILNLIELFDMVKQKVNRFLIIVQKKKKPKFKWFDYFLPKQSPKFYEKVKMKWNSCAKSISIHNWSNQKSKLRSEWKCLFIVVYHNKSGTVYSNFCCCCWCCFGFSVMCTFDLSIELFIQYAYMYISVCMIYNRQLKWKISERKKKHICVHKESKKGVREYTNRQ